MGEIYIANDVKMTLMIIFAVYSIIITGIGLYLLKTVILFMKMFNYVDSENTGLKVQINLLNNLVESLQESKKSELKSESKSESKSN